MQHRHFAIQLDQSAPQHGLGRFPGSASSSCTDIEEAKAIITRGGHPSLVVDNYQKIVTANVARLSVTEGVRSRARCIAGLSGFNLQPTFACIFQGFATFRPVMHLASPK